MKSHEQKAAGFICDGWGPGSSRDDCNARLIACAPEMLEALELIAASSPDAGVRALCAKIIARAKGDA